MSSNLNILIGNKKTSHFFGINNSTSTDTNTRTQSASVRKHKLHPTLLTHCRRTMGWAVMALSLAVGMTLLCGQARADNASWMNNLSKADWMGKLTAGTRLSSISLPGTHDSGATVNNPLSQTQNMDIATQLNSGIRVFDIRLRGNSTCSGSLKVYHGPIYQEKEFLPDVIIPINLFLSAHPTEAVVMRIKREDGDCNSGFHGMVKTAFDMYPELLYTGADPNPLLKDIRKKVVVLRNFDLDPTLPVIGFNWGSIQMQDNFELPSEPPPNETFDNKWNTIKAQFDQTNADPNSLRVNFLSAVGAQAGVTNGYYPSTVAKGGVVNYLGFIPWYLEKGMNVRTREYLESGVVYHTGIVFADFPDGGLIKDIIGVNFRFLERTVSFFAGNNKWVCAEHAGTSLLYANRDAVGQWERFEVVDDGDGWIGLRAQANNQFVSSLNNVPPLYLLSNRNTVGEYGKFRFVYQGGGFYALRAKFNLNYVTVGSDGASSPLVVSSPNIGNLEKFTVLY